MRVDTENSELDETEIDAFINSRWIITVRKNEGFSMDPVLRRWDRSGDLAKHGVSFLLYGLLDVIVDGYFETVQAFDDYYDEVSEGIFSERPLDPAQQRHWFKMRQALVRFHRLAVPLREAVSGLMRREHSAVSESLYPYFQDVYDHILRVSESTDALRDLVSTIVETNLSLRDYRQNQVMKKVTSWAAIIAVPTLITGYYGMMSVEDFGTYSVGGARLAYHVTEGLFAEATYAQTSDVDKSSAEILGNYDLSFGSDRKYKYYDLSLGYNLLPGEVFIGKNHSFNSAFYVVAGAGNTTFHDEDMFTLSFGGGYRLLLTDAIGLHFDVRDHTVFFVSPGQIHAWVSSVQPRGWVINFSTEFFVRMFPRSEDIARFPFFHLANDHAKRNNLPLEKALALAPDAIHGFAGSQGNRLHRAAFRSGNCA